ncbi:MAG: recombinase family protein [Paludibacteraceae bacterium]|nr:recombinase family protein [Paludibacteraceae bacterium]
MKRVAIYVRVSTQEQKKHGLSVDSQIDALEQYCKDNNYEIAGIYNDAGISARKKYTKRPALLRLINDCKAGKVDLIAFTKLDRWFRSVADYYEVQTQLDSCSVPWRAIWEDYETETSSGVFKVNIMLSVAQSEADRTSERIKSVFEYKKAQGDYVGCAPRGYHKEKGKLINDHSELVSLAFEYYLSSHSSTYTLRKLNDKGHKISRSGLWHLLHNRAYAGMADNGYKCEPYITQEQFDEVQRILEGNYLTHQREYIYYYSGLCTCALCDKKMRSLTRHDPNGKDYKNYYCTGTDSIIKHDQHVALSERKLEKYILDNLDTILNDYNVSIESSSVEIDYKKERDKLEKKLERIGIRFEEGDIDADEYREKRKAILNSIASLKRSPSQAVELPNNWRDVYMSLDDEHKRAFWYSIIDKIYLSPKGTQPPKIVFKSY